MGKFLVYTYKGWGQTVVKQFAVNVHCLPIPIFNILVQYPFHVSEAITGCWYAVEACTLLKGVPWNTSYSFKKSWLSAVGTAYLLCHSSQSRYSGEGSVPPDHLQFFLSFFWSRAVYRTTGSWKSHSGDASFFFPRDFLQASVLRPPLPRSIQASGRRTGACLVCSRCTPAVCYSRNVVKHLRESVTNTVSVTIQK